MAFLSKYGKKFGSKFAADRHSADHSEDGMHTEGKEHEGKEDMHEEQPAIGEEREEMNEGEHEKEAEEKTGEEEHPVVAEHGPAHKVVISHDEEAGRHTVTSHHGDGHSHTNVHEHAHKAHDEARQLAAVPPAGKEGNEEEEGFGHKSQGQQGAPSESDGFAMPNLV